MSSSIVFNWSRFSQYFQVQTLVNIDIVSLHVKNKLYVCICILCIPVTEWCNKVKCIHRLGKDHWASPRASWLQGMSKSLYYSQIVSAKYRSIYFKMADTEDSLPSADVVLSSMKSCGIFDEFRKTCLQALESDVTITNNTFACFYYILYVSRYVVQSRSIRVFCLPLIARVLETRF